MADLNGGASAPRDQERPCEDAFGDMVYWKWEGILPQHAICSAVGFIERALELTPGARVLDLGCGLGHHAIDLARRGYDVTGLEQSRPFIEVAQRQAAEAGVRVRFVQGDMARVTFDREFDAALLWGNTFGMLADEENVATLRGIRRALKDGGRALIDTQNYTALPTELKQGWLFHAEEPNLLFLTQGTRDVPQGRFGFDVLAVDLATGARHEMSFSWRLYLLPELEHLVAAAGLQLLGVYGDDPARVNWRDFAKGDPYPYATDGFTERAAKRILLCRVSPDASERCDA